MRSHRRAVLAAVLAVVYPGLGHVYLREWVRAVAWFGLALLTAVVVVPESTVVALESNGLAALASASEDLPLEAFLALLAVRLLNAIDAAVLGLRPAPVQDPKTVTCPSCGRELDDDLDFCHWCTQPLRTAETG